jgi:hypothetical protein
MAALLQFRMLQHYPMCATGLEEEQEHGIVDAMFEKPVGADEVVIRSADKLPPLQWARHRHVPRRQTQVQYILRCLCALLVLQGGRGGR